MLPTLREYQLRAVQSMVRELMYRDSTLRVAATGTGKTAEIGALARIHLRRGGRRVLVTAPRGELLDQAEDWVQRWCPFLHPSQIGREQSTSHCHDGHKVVLASLQSLSPERVESMPEFDLVIEDEGHMFFDQRSDSGWWPKAKRAGFTATPDRSDFRSLIPARYESCPPDQVFEIGEAIKRGYLSKPKFKKVTLDCLDFAGLPRAGGDFESESLSKMMRKGIAIHGTIEAMQQLTGGRKTLVFCVDIDHATRLCDQINCAAPGRIARLAHGNLSKRERHDNLAGFIAGDFPILVTVVLLTYGWDAPPTSCVVMARPTMSRALYCLDSETEILTDQGWVGIDNEVERPVKIAQYHVDTSAVSWSRGKNPIIKRWGYPDERFVEYESPGLSIRVTDTHTMVWMGRRDRDLRLTPAEELLTRRSGFVLPVAGWQEAPGLPLTDDEIRFVGWVMSDGSINKTNGQIQITQGEHQPWLEEIQRVIDACYFKHNRFTRARKTQYNETSPCVTWTISKGKPRGRDKHLRGWGELEPYLSKDLAETWEQADRVQVLALIQALHLGDGAKQLGQQWTRRSYHISSGNRTFCDRLQSLCVRRGLRASVAQYAENRYCIHIKNKPVRHVGGTSSRDRPTFREGGSAAEERVWCAETDEGTLIVRRHGKVCVVGNCQSIGRGLRLHPGKEDCLILDLVGNTDEHRLVTPEEALAPQYEEYQQAPGDFLVAAAGAASDDAVEDHLTDDPDDQSYVPELEVQSFTVTEVQGQLEPLGIDTGKRLPDSPPATLKQVLALKKMGVDHADLLSLGQASDLIGELVERNEAGWCTLRQAMFLWRKGLNPRVKRDLAASAISRIIANDGRVPLKLRTDERLVHRQKKAVVMK